MTVLDDLGQKLNETRKEVDRVVSDLNEYVELKDALESIDKSLKGSSEKLGKLTDSLKENAEGLGNCIDSFQEAVELLRQIDPAGIKGGLYKIGENLAEMEGKVDKNAKRTEEKIEEVGQLLKRASLREWTLLLLVIANLGAWLFFFFYERGII